MDGGGVCGVFGQGTFQMHNALPDGHVGRIAGDADALEVFYRGHVTAVSRFIARRVDDPYQVADLTAEIFIAAIGSAHSFLPGRGTQLGWLYGIARNVLSADRRRLARELDAAGRFAGRRLLDDDDIARLEDRIDAESAARDVVRAIAGLPGDERAVLELVAIDGIAVTDAAAALGVRPGTARVRLHRARRAAKAALSAGPLAGRRTPNSSTSRSEHAARSR